MQNSVPAGGEDDVAARIARRTLASRAPDYSGEVRRLLDAGREVMHRSGTDTRPRVADIVRAAGLSNDAFYRHFASKDALVAAILEDGTERLRSYLAHQMQKQRAPERQVRAWVEGVLAQASDDDSAATTRAVLWNAGSLGSGTVAGSPSTILAPLLEVPFRALGSDDAASDATLVAHAVVGTLSDHLRDGVPPTKRDVDRVMAFCLAAIHR